MVALLWRRTMVAPRRAVPKDEARRIAANIAKPPELLQLNGVKLVIAGRRSYPTFPPPLRVSYSIQIPKTIRLKHKDTGAFKPPAPQRPCGIRAYKTPARPSWGLFHLRLASSPVSASASEWSGSLDGGELRQAAEPSGRPLNHYDALGITVAALGEVQDQARRPCGERAKVGHSLCDHRDVASNLDLHIWGVTVEACSQRAMSALAPNSGSIAATTI